MRLELTVRGAGSAAPGTDLVVHAPAGTALREVLPRLAAAAGLPVPWSGDVLVDDEPVAGHAPLGSAPLVRGAELVLTARPGDRGAPPPTREGLLRVLSGPDAGAGAPVPLGRARLGRGAGSLVPLTDPTASRHHVELDTAPAGTRVRDAGSANGTRLDGRRLPEGWTALAPGALLQVGAGVLQVLPSQGLSGHPRRAAVADGRGRLVLDPAAGPGPERPAPVEVALPPVPGPRAATAVPWAAVLAPALVAVPLALLWSPVALLLAATGPLVALLTAAADRRRRRREHARALAEHREAVDRAHARAERALAVERATLEQLHPAAGALLDLVRTRGALLWASPAEQADRGGGLRVRLGTAVVESAVVVAEASEDDDGPAPVDTAAIGRGRLEHAAGPLVVDLAGLHRVEVRGAPAVVRGAARGLVAQLATLHGPDRVRLELVSPPGAAPDAGAGGPGPWAWARWLPHAGPDRGDGRGGRVSPVHVRVVDAAALDSASATVVVDLGQGGEPAPAAAVAVLEVREGGSATWCAGGTTTALVVDLLTAERAERLARALAPMVPAGWHGSGDGPAAPALSALLSGTAGVDPLDPRSLARAWDAPRGHGAAVAVGVRTGGGPWVLDLDRDGPHALVAGTTGAGKSSLLVAWLLALAVAVPPEELSVVLVDYKGGATAGRLRGLPHLVGCVTDLDEHLAQRALTSLTAEVRRRERVLAEHGVSDRAELLRVVPGGARVLPRLLVVVDEVRVLADEVPDLVPGLVRLAAVGRSLGVHLVLATQRPAGAVSADARANTNLRVALRVRDAADSVDVIDDPGAAGLPPERPGAALVRRGGRELEAVQVASLLRAPSTPVRVTAAGEEVPPAGRPVDEVPLLVAAVRAAALGRPGALVGGRVSGRIGEGARAPWLPPLPDLLPWRHPRDAPAAGAAGAAHPGEDDEDDGLPLGLPLGLLDDPEVPAQPVLRWDGRGPLAVCGGPGSGRTALLRWVAAASAREVHLVGSPAELADLAALQQVASTVDPDDGEHLVRVLQHVTGALRDRRRPGPAPLLLVDAADRVLAGRAAAGQRHEAEAAADLLAGLVAAGAPVVLTCDAAALTSRGLAGVREVLLLAPADRTAAVLAGVPSAAAPVRWPPGRALRLRPGPLRECQLALLGPLPRRPDPADPADPADPGRVVEVPALPGHLPLAALRTLAAAAAAAPAVGVGGLRCAPQRLELAAGGGALVVGPPGSGRSSVLSLLAVQAEAAGRRTVLVRPRPPLPGTDPVGTGPPSATGSVVAGTDAAAGNTLLAALARSSDASGPDAQVPLVLVDDAELVLGTPLEALLLDLVDGDGPPCAVVAAGTSGSTPSHRGLAAALRRHRSGLLLHPLAPGDAELLGARAPLVRAGPPGRASLVRGGALTAVQLAQP